MGNMTPLKDNNHITKDLMHIQGDESSVSELKRMIIGMIMRLKRTCKNKSIKSKTMDKHREGTKTTK
jgi:hypothetical protein